MSVRDESQNHGYGSELLGEAIRVCDDWMNVLRMELTVYTDNHKAVSLYKKHGFVIEGEHSHYAYRGGDYVNAYCMARIRP